MNLKPTHSARFIRFLLAVVFAGLTTGAPGIAHAVPKPQKPARPKHSNAAGRHHLLQIDRQRAAQSARNQQRHNRFLQLAAQRKAANARTNANRNAAQRALLQQQLQAAKLAQKSRYDQRTANKSHVRRQAARHQENATKRRELSRQIDPWRTP